MKSNENPFSVLGLLESAHCFEPCIKMTDVRLKPVCGGRNPGIDKVPESVAAGFLETLQDVVMDWTQAKDICLDDSL